MSDDLALGIYPKKPSPKAPDFVIGGLSINIPQFREWVQGYLQSNPDAEWINLDMKESKAGKGYAVLNTWTPEEKAPAPEPAPLVEPEDDVPF